jgi:hypothetical protein
LRTFVVVSRSMPSPRHQRSRKRLLPDRLARSNCSDRARTAAPKASCERAASLFGSKVAGSRCACPALGKHRARGARCLQWPSRWVASRQHQANLAAICHAWKITVRVSTAAAPHASVFVSAGYSLPIVAGAHSTDHGCRLRACAQRSVTCSGHVGSMLADKKLGSVVPYRGRP